MFTVQRRKLFQDSNFPKSYLPQIRGSSWHNNERKMIRSGHYSSNNFQDSNKIGMIFQVIVVPVEGIGVEA
jgi:hypothetical protein